MVVSEPGRKLGYLNSKLMLRWDGHFNIEYQSESEYVAKLMKIQSRRCGALKSPVGGRQMRR